MPDMDAGQRERLAMLIEECGEVIQAATKALRHGMNSCHPVSGINNRAFLRREIEDVVAVVTALQRHGDVGSIVNIGAPGAAIIWDRKLKWTHCQGALPPDLATLPGRLGGQAGDGVG